MADKKAVITLNDKESATLERGGGGYNVRLTTDNTVIATIDADTTLVIEGAGGKAAVLTIPEHVGIDKDEFVPRIQVDTDKPIGVKGGTFILAKESTEAAWVMTEPVGLAGIGIKTGDDGKPVISLAEDRLRHPEAGDGRFAGDAQLFNFRNTTGQTRTVALENGGGKIYFFTPEALDAERPKPEFSLSGAKSLDDNRQAFTQYREETLSEVTAALKSGTREEKMSLGIPSSFARANPPEKKPAAPERGGTLQDKVEKIEQMAKEQLSPKAQEIVLPLIEKLKTSNGPQFEKNRALLEGTLQSIREDRRQEEKEQRYTPQDHAAAGPLERAVEAELGPQQKGPGKEAPDLILEINRTQALANEKISEEITAGTRKIFNDLRRDAGDLAAGKEGAQESLDKHMDELRAALGSAAKTARGMDKQFKALEKAAAPKAKEEEKTTGAVIPQDILDQARLAVHPSIKGQSAADLSVLPQGRSHSANTLQPSNERQI